MTIGEIAEKTGLPESTLRYYEKKGLKNPWYYRHFCGKIYWRSKRLTAQYKVMHTAA